MTVMACCSFHADIVVVFHCPSYVVFKVGKYQLYFWLYFSIVIVANCNLTPDCSLLCLHVRFLRKL